MDRQSGEFTQVETAGGGENGEADERRGSSNKVVGGGSVRDRIASLNKPETGGGGSVRDRIANMNIKGAEAEVGKRKGNSLPRSTDGGGGLAKSPNTARKSVYAVIAYVMPQLVLGKNIRA